MAWDLVGNLKGPQGDPGDPGVAFDDGAAPTTSAVADAAATGDDTFAARRDHVHGREAFGSPSTQAFGDSPTNGAATTVPRSDHKHGMPANPVPAFGSPGNSAVGDTANDGVATTLPRSDHRHGREAFGSPAASAVGDVSADGAATTLARSNHVHAREGFAAPAASAVTDSGTTGVATTLVHSDHKHAREGFGAPAASAVGDAQATGTATTVPHSDHVHARESFGAASGLLLKSTAADGSGASPLRADASIKAFDTTAPTTSAMGDAAAVGTVDFAARRDHKHGRESFATNTIGLGTTASAGTVDQPIRSDCNIAAFDTFTASTQAFDDAATTGATNFAARRDHKHGMPSALFATSAPSAVAQSGAVTFTTTRARLFTMGKFVTYVCQITITAAGSSGSAIAVTLPFTWAANAGQAYGAFRYDRASGPIHFGNASQAASTNQIAFGVPTLGFLGISPAFATANGDILWFTVSGETT